ncbi:alpha/beta fold hydrolase [Flavobacterium sp. NRK1]|uniref:alpha/beta fold hydrolase n=1 Tax=Flavobacterium sp. NRK1 TaxID=2954929 RepID=UPI002093284A|nr:alpha/beta hydrolase [Flavobacterium sp. NRK1]MCO6147429.1 alpha/beta hydrolase [Flavobacterium sp. NRK1]
MKNLNYKNINIAYSDTGKGTAIVLLHGFLESAVMWDFFVAEYSKKYRVITIDLLGHGQTECLGYVHTMEDMADAVHAVLHELRIRKAIFMGHSMGGYVALAFAELYPDMIKGIVLQNSTSRADSDERKKNRDRAIKAVKQNYTAFVRMSIANLFSEENRDRLADDIEALREQAVKTPLQGIVAALEGMKVRNDREVILHFSPYPIMLVLGRHDQSLIYSEQADQVENTDVKLVSYPYGHMSHIENRDELLAETLAFFKTC